MEFARFEFDGRGIQAEIYFENELAADEAFFLEPLADGRVGLAVFDGEGGKLVGSVAAAYLGFIVTISTVSPSRREGEDKKNDY